MNLSKRGRWGIIACVILVVLLIVVGIIHALVQQHDNQYKAQTVYIAGIDDCSKNINSSIVDSINSQLYNFVKGANDYNKITSLPNYQSVVRKGSCQNLAGDQQGNTTTTSIIVDVPTAKQSWRVTYTWVPNNASITSDLGQITVGCPSTSQLIYGNFNCSDVINFLTYGTSKINGILQYVPYSGAGFNLAYNPTTNVVTASIIVKPANQDNQILIDNMKALIEYWFTKRSLDITKYTVNYTIVTNNDGL